MSRLQFRGSIAWAAVVVALLSSTPADAQVGIDPGPPREPGGLVNNVLTGVQYDIVNQKLAVHRLEYLQAKLRRDTERCNAAAIQRDVRQIDNVEYRIAMDEWLIRWNSRQNPGFYTIRPDPVSRAAIAQAIHPIPGPYSMGFDPATAPGLMDVNPTIPYMITISNVAPTGSSVSFTIDGVTRQAAGGSQQDLTVPPESTITYDAGGSLGQRRYLLSPGVYEFRSTPEGLALYKLPVMPGMGTMPRY